MSEEGIVPEHCATQFLGYFVDFSRLQPTATKVQAIQQVLTFTNKMELKAFLGLLSFYNMFMPHKTSVAELLHCLLDKKVPNFWVWKEATTFQAAKSVLSSENILVQYNEKQPLVLTCDASPFSIAAVLSHQFADSLETTITCFSRTSLSAERNYSQLDKEALALVAVIKYLFIYFGGI